MPDHELRRRTRNRYETEYKANFRTPDLKEAYSPPKLRPRGLEELFRKEPAKLLPHHDKHEPEKVRDSPPIHDKNITYQVVPHDRQGSSNVSPAQPRPLPSEQQRRKIDRPPSDRALRYRAGQALEIPRPVRQNFVSEYQRQFGWKNLPHQESPMLSADKVVFESKADVPAATKDINLPFKTEYQVQFREFPTFERRKSERQAPAEDNRQKTTKPELLTGIPEKEVMKCPAPSRQAAHSEYLSNFQPPSKYRYVKGAWLGAAPPHLMPSGDDTEQKAGKDAPAEKHNAWFQQVLELRQRASSYKERALGGSEFMRVLWKLGEEQSQILRRAQENSEEQPKAARTRSEAVGSNRRRSEDVGSNSHHARGLGLDRHSDGSGSQYSGDSDDVASTGFSDSHSAASR